MDASYLIVIALLAAAVMLIFALGSMIVRRKPQEPQALPTEWNLTARPVFSTDERRVYRQLREALPHHIVLSKLPLVRFCQPLDPQEVRYWYDLLGTINVTFAVCSPNGRVLAAIDLDTDRGNSRRVLQIKQSVLGASRVRYLRCPVDHMPSVAELQLLVPHSTAASRGPQPASWMTTPSSDEASASSPTPTAPSPAGEERRRRGRATLWQDSSFFQDSFFGADARDLASVGAASEFGDGGAPVASESTESTPGRPAQVGVRSAASAATRH